MTRASTARGSTSKSLQNTHGSSQATYRSRTRPATRKRVDPAIPEYGVALEAILMIVSLFDDVISVRPAILTRCTACTRFDTLNVSWWPVRSKIRRPQMFGT